MKKDNISYNGFIRILNKELVPAMGCTEPIALAFCAAACRDLIGSKFDIDKIDQINVCISPNIIKNVKSVVVPNTGGRKGIEAAVAIGIVAGKKELGLEAISNVESKQREKMTELLSMDKINVSPTDDGVVLSITVEIRMRNDCGVVQILNEHTNIVFEQKNDNIVTDEREANLLKEKGIDNPDYKLLNLEAIYDFATTVDIEDVREVIENQVKCNSLISEEGLLKDYGANIGKTLLKYGDDSVVTRAKAAAAAVSDARMNGCELPVVINSGSGNQGGTTSMPVIVYAKEYKVSNELLIRALVLSNLVTIHQKRFIGRLSAFCGVVSAGAGASAGITLILGGGYDEVAHSIVNTLGMASGMICDGAKSSCAGKIATAVETGILGYEMYKNGQQFYEGDGIIGSSVEDTIKNIGIVAKDGMEITDKEVIRIMINK